MLNRRSVTKGLVRALVLPTTGISTKFYFHFALGFSTQTLAGMLDSLVRVSRRVGSSHYASILSMFREQKLLRPTEGHAEFLNPNHHM